MSGVLAVQRVIGRRGADLGANDLIGQRQRTRRRGRIGAQIKEVRPNLQGIALGEDRRRTDAAAIDEGAVAAADILDEVFAAVTENAGVLAADRQRIEIDRRVFLPADKNTIACQHEALAGIRSLDGHQRVHAVGQPHLLVRRSAKVESRQPSADFALAVGR